MVTNPDDPANPAPEGRAGFKGLTKREAMAAMILAAICARPNTDTDDEDAMVLGAIRATDKLIDALNSHPANTSARVKLEKTQRDYEDDWGGEG